MLNRIKIGTRNISYELCFQSKYTVLTGLSGSGKSLLINTIQKLNRAFPDATYDGYKVYASVYSKELTDTILSNSGALIIVDEDVDSEARKKYFPSIKNSKNYFIFITRDLYDIPYGVSDIFELTGNKKHNRMVQKYRIPNKIFKGNALLCEDAASGFHITKSVFEPHNYSVFSAKGKDKLLSACNSLNFDNLIFLVDLCGLGAATFPLIDLVTKKAGYAMYPSKSFEYELLAHPLIHSEDKRDPDPEELLSYPSEESYYSSIVSSVLSDKYGLHYDRSSRNIIRFLLTGYSVLGSNRSKAPTPDTDSWLYPLLPRPASPVEDPA